MDGHSSPFGGDPAPKEQSMMGGLFLPVRPAVSTSSVESSSVV